MRFVVQSVSRHSRLIGNDYAKAVECDLIQAESDNDVHIRFYAKPETLKPRDPFYPEDIERLVIHPEVSARI